MSKQNLECENRHGRRKTTESCKTFVTHADHLALGNIFFDGSTTAADTTTIRPREVVGPLMEVVARPMLTPQDHTFNYTENELPTSGRVLTLFDLVEPDGTGGTGRNGARLFMTGRSVPS